MGQFIQLPHSTRNDGFAVLIVRNAEWFATVPFAITLLITYLGLLIWETKHVSASLAFPGVMP